jgi:hypothetical protein
MYLPYYNTESKNAFEEFEKVREKLIKKVNDYLFKHQFENFIATCPVGYVMSAEELLKMDELKKEPSISDELFKETISHVISDLRKKFYIWRIELFNAIENYNHCQHGEENLITLLMNTTEHHTDFCAMLEFIRYQIKNELIDDISPMIPF